MIEEWRPILGFEGLYEVSDQGRVRSLPRQTKTGIRGGAIIVPSWAHGYPLAGLYKNGRQTRKGIHRLVLEAFVGPCPPKHEGAHNNGIASDCRLSNLRWATKKDNNDDQLIHGTRPFGERNGQSKLTASDILAIRELRGALSQSKIAARYGISRPHVKDIQLHRRWSWLRGEETSNA